MSEKAASRFMIEAICDWPGQKEETKIAAVQQLLDEAGFKATATSFPVFGGIWFSPCAGPDGEEATKWLKDLTDNLKRGKIEREIEQVQAAIEKRKAA